VTEILLGSRKKYFSGKDSCYGDSTGPLIAIQRYSKRMVLAGVVTSNTPQCGENLPGIYANVFKHLDWIRKHTSASD